MEYRGKKNGRPLQDRPDSLDQKAIGKVWLSDEKKVTFNEAVTVQIIPSREDLAEIHYDIWYVQADFFNFRGEAMEELRQFMNMHEIEEIGQAVMYLYQPNNLVQNSTSMR